jgi:hypothetical protein
MLLEPLSQFPLEITDIVILVFPIYRKVEELLLLGDLIIYDLRRVL